MVKAARKEIEVNMRIGKQIQILESFNLFIYK